MYQAAFHSHQLRVQDFGNDLGHRSGVHGMASVMKCSLIFFLFFVAFPIYAQISTTQHFISQDEGLLESTNAFIFKDKKGFVWISSLDGLHRFDGKNMKVFRMDTTDSKSIYGNNIQSPFFQNKKGDIWFVTEDAINCYRSQRGNFDHYFIRKNLIPDIGEQYYAFYLEKDRFLWVRADNFLYRFDTYFPNDVTKIQALHNSSAVRCAVFCDKNGQIRRIYGCYWDLQPGVEITDYDSNGKFLKRQTLFSGIAQRPLTIRQALIKNDSTAWLASNEGLIQLSVGKKIKFTLYPFQEKSEEGVRALIRKSAHQFWGITQTQGEIFLFDELKENIQISNLKFNSNEYSAAFPIKSFYIKKNEFWGSAYGQGLFYTKILQSNIYHPMPKTKIGVNDVTQIHLGVDQLIRVTTRTGQTLVFNSKRQLLDQFKMLAGSRIFQDDQAKIWIYSDKGIAYLNHKNRTPPPLFYTNGKYVYFDAYKLNNQKLLLISELGICVLNRKKPIYDKIYELPAINVLHGNGVDKIWVGTDGQLLLLKQINESDFQTLKTFQTGYVTTILAPPQDSNLWVATLTGLRKFNRFTLKEDKRTPCPPELNHAIQAMAFDHRGTLWLGGNRGIFAYHPITGALRHFTQRDGLHSSEFSPGAMQVDDLGNIWAGGNNGLDVINPDILHQRAAPPQLAITGLKIYDKDWEGPTAIEETHQISLPYDQNTLKFELAAMEYTDPARNQFKVFLKNYDRQWSNLSTQNFITYANLPPGKYQFMFTASNAQGIWQKQVKKLDIFITPPYWRTWWFTTLIILAVSTLIYAFFQYREQQRKKQERMRQQIARDLHDDVGSTLSSISILSESFLHSVEADLDKIRFSNIGEKARIALENISDIVWSVNPENDSMEKLLAKMSAFAFEMLENVGTELLFQVGENMGSIALPIEKRKDFYLIFKEAIHNCAKYAQAKHVEMRLEVKNNTLHMSIKDDGIGFDPDKIENPGMGGNGLKNMQRRTAAIGGTFSIQSNPGDGVTLHLAVPLVT